MSNCGYLKAGFAWVSAFAMLMTTFAHAVAPVDFVSSFIAARASSGIATGDLNGDTYLDIVASSDVVTVIFGNGDGTFGFETNYAVAQTPYYVALEDLNADQVLDVVSANGAVFPTGTTISILMNQGSGTFGPATNYTVGAYPYSVAFGDFNKDGVIDIACGESVATNSLCILLGTGGGDFGVLTNYTLPSPVSVVAGDFNQDGFVDLATANYWGGSVSVLAGQGDGSFVLTTNIVMPNYPRCVVVADFDRNGTADLAAAIAGPSANKDNRVVILLGQGNGNFQAYHTNTVGKMPRGMAVADFNGDGCPDIATANYDANTLSILLGTGTGTFTRGPTVTNDASTVSLATGDFNRDGKPDIAATGSGRINILLNQTAPSLRIERGTDCRLFWPTWPGYSVQSSTNVSSGWDFETVTPAVTNAENVITFAPTVEEKFFRLIKQ